MHADPGCDFTNDQVEEYTVHDLWVMGLLHPPAICSTLIQLS